MKAFRIRVESSYFPNMDDAIYWAADAGKARYKCLLNNRDSGYKFINITDIIVHRSPEYDNCYDKYNSGTMEVLLKKEK